MLRSSVWDVFNNFLLIDATDRSKISIDQKRFFYRIKPIPLSFFANTPFSIYSAFTSNGPHLICFSSIEISVGAINYPPPPAFKAVRLFLNTGEHRFFYLGGCDCVKCGIQRKTKFLLVFFNFKRGKWVNKRLNTMSLLSI